MTRIGEFTCSNRGGGIFIDMIWKIIDSEVDTSNGESLARSITISLRESSNMGETPPNLIAAVMHTPNGVNKNKNCCRNSLYPKRDHFIPNRKKKSPQA